MYLRFCISAVMLLSVYGCNRQPKVSFKDTLAGRVISSVTFYDVDPMGPEYVNCDLAKITSSAYDIDIFKNLIKDAKPSSALDKPLWMGSHLCVIRLENDEEIKLAVSVYGSFFKVLGENTIYKFSDNPSASEEWNRTLRQITNTFIDKRIQDKQVSSNAQGESLVQ